MMRSRGLNTIGLNVSFTPSALGKMLGIRNSRRLSLHSLCSAHGPFGQRPAVPDAQHLYAQRRRCNDTFKPMNCSSPLERTVIRFTQPLKWVYEGSQDRSSALERWRHAGEGNSNGRCRRHIASTRRRWVRMLRMLDGYS
jgi:hypothetical protein